ncbi:hypothetical protein ACRRTK_019443 [Alexandromys fortis]
MPKLPAIVVLLLSIFCAVLAKSVRLHAADLQNVQQSPSEGKCPPGSYLSDEDGCVPCMEGIEYTSHANTLPSCIKCTVCAADQDEIARCNSTQDTKCQCKPGTFKDENSPEFCRKCSECTDEESEKVSCTPNTNRICVPKDSRLNLGLIIGLVVAGLLLLLIIILARVFIWKLGAWGRALQFVKRACPGREQHSENSVPLRELRTSNAENDSPAMKASEGPEEAPDSPTEAESLVPANGIDPIDANVSNDSKAGDSWLCLNPDSIDQEHLGEANRLLPEKLLESFPGTPEFEQTGPAKYDAVGSKENFSELRKQLFVDFEKPRDPESAQP